MNHQVGNSIYCLLEMVWAAPAAAPVGSDMSFIDMSC